jgi:hypothetical protein
MFSRKEERKGGREGERNKGRTNEKCQSLLETPFNQFHFLCFHSQPESENIHWKTPEINNQ